MKIFTRKFWIARKKAKKKGIKVKSRTVEIHPDLEDLRERIQNYGTVVNMPPSPGKIKINPQVDNWKYLPIDNVEQELNMLYLTHWYCKPFAPTTDIGTAMQHDCVLSVLHPVTQIWIHQGGYGVEEYKVDNTSGIALPGEKPRAGRFAVKMALKDAAKKLGRRFGGGLNRDEEAQYYRYYNQKPVNPSGES